MIICAKGYPRAGLIGNPSDGYNGKTIAFAFSNFSAEVILYETPELEILPDKRDHSRFSSVKELVDDVGLYGYYGGIRLLKAAIKRFYEYCTTQGATLHGRNFTIRYRSDIPHMVGLAGSSAIITACMRALMEFYGVRIPRPQLANLILAVEKEELGISAGLQDRVAQVYQGLVYMDFDLSLMERQGYGRYEEMPSELLPPLYIAYRSALAQSSEVFHNTLRDRYVKGDAEVMKAIAFWMGLTDTVRDCIVVRRYAELPALLNANFDRRAALCQISTGNLRMVAAARATGASAKFTGSGGAIVGTYRDESMFQALKTTLEPMGIHVIRPEIAPPVGEAKP